MAILYIAKCPTSKVNLGEKKIALAEIKKKVKPRRQLKVAIHPVDTD